MTPLWDLAPEQAVVQVLSALLGPATEWTSAEIDAALETYLAYLPPFAEPVARGEGTVFFTPPSAPGGVLWMEHHATADRLWPVRWLGAVRQERGQTVYRWVWLDGPASGEQEEGLKRVRGHFLMAAHAGDSRWADRRDARDFQQIVDGVQVTLRRGKADAGGPGQRVWSLWRKGTSGAPAAMEGTVTLPNGAPDGLAALRLGYPEIVPSWARVLPQEARVEQAAPSAFSTPPPPRLDYSLRFDYPEVQAAMTGGRKARGIYYPAAVEGLVRWMEANHPAVKNIQALVAWFNAALRLAPNYSRYNQSGESELAQRIRSIIGAPSAPGSVESMVLNRIDAAHYWGSHVREAFQAPGPLDVQRGPRTGKDLYALRTTCPSNGFQCDEEILATPSMVERVMRAYWDAIVLGRDPGSSDKGDHIRDMEVLACPEFYLMGLNDGYEYLRRSGASRLYMDRWLALHGIQQVTSESGAIEKKWREDMAEGRVKPSDYFRALDLPIPPPWRPRYDSALSVREKTRQRIGERRRPRQAPPRSPPWWRAGWWPRLPSRSRAAFAAPRWPEPPGCRRSAIPWI